MIAFWRGALGYEQRGPRDEGWTLLYDPHRAGPNLAFRKDPNAPGPFWWIHLDLYSSDPENEVKRLVALGATIQEPAQADRDFVTLSDPDGNPFDVVQTPSYRFGQRSD
ncbi:MAG: VOC family protein [Thermoplasmata archaeon]|nr:VOC family protein [Thermoplasmata archaeon]